MAKEDKKAGITSKWWFWPIIGAVLVGGLITLGLLLSKSQVTKENDASNSNTYYQQSSPKENIEHSTDELVEVNGIYVNVSMVQRDYQTHNKYEEPGYGNEFVKIWVDVINRTGKKAKYNMLDWGAETSSGAILRPGVASYSFVTPLSSGELIDGGMASGGIVFEVPKGDAIKIHYNNPNDLSDEEVVVKI